MSDYLFVYGTLLPGKAPASMAPVVAGLHVVSAAWVPGRLYDLGAYPGLIVDSAAVQRVHGVVVRLPCPDVQWPQLDRYEGYTAQTPHASLYCRRRCVAQLATGHSLPVWVYVYNRPVAEAALVTSGDWQLYQASTSQPARPL